MTRPFRKLSPFQKYDPILGIVFGFSIVSKHVNPETGVLEDYYDTGYEHEGEWYQDHIPEDAMLRASLKFADSSRVAGDMHKSAAVSALQNAASAISDPAIRAEAEALVAKAGKSSHPKLVSPAGPASAPYSKVVQRGDVPYLFPLTSDIAGPLGIQTESTGLLTGIRPDEALRKEFEAGNYTGFSIGGVRVRDRLVEE